MEDAMLIQKVFDVLLILTFGAWAFVVRQGVNKVDIIASRLDAIVERLARLEERVAHIHVEVNRDIQRGDR